MTIKFRMKTDGKMANEKLLASEIKWPLHQPELMSLWISKLSTFSWSNALYRTPPDVI